jgi:hypothetical protein
VALIDSGRPSERLTQLRLYVTAGALCLAFLHLILPGLAIDAITLALLAIAVIPWLAPLVESLELPGGWKVEFWEMQRAVARVQAAGPVYEDRVSAGSEAEYSFQLVYSRDPNLALAGLRIEIEKRLSALAEKADVAVRPKGVVTLLRSLSNHELLSFEERAALGDMSGLLNSAVHGAVVDPRACEWAIDNGPPLLASLDAKLDELSRATEDPG